MKANRLVLLAAAATALLTFAGCSPAGDTAIKVDKTTFSSDDVDLFTDFQCGYLQSVGASQGQVPALSRQDARSQIATFLVASVLDQQIADKAGVTADEAQVQATIKQLNATIDKVAKGDDRKRLTELVTDYLRSQIAIQRTVVATIGESTLNNLGQEAGTQAIQQAITTAQDAVAKHADIDVDPVYGLDADGLKLGSSGSLSVATSTFAKNATAGNPDSTWLSALPKTQRCS